MDRRRFGFACKLKIAELNFYWYFNRHSIAQVPLFDFGEEACVHSLQAKGMGIFRFAPSKMVNCVAPDAPARGWAD
jgi:hypothetical protein